MSHNCVLLETEIALRCRDVRYERHSDNKEFSLLVYCATMKEMFDPLSLLKLQEKSSRFCPPTVGAGMSMQPPPYSSLMSFCTPRFQH